MVTQPWVFENVQTSSPQYVTAASYMENLLSGFLGMFPICVHVPTHCPSAFRERIQSSLMRIAGHWIILTTACQRSEALLVLRATSHTVFEMPETGHVGRSDQRTNYLR